MSDQSTIASLRREYSRAELLETTAEKDPVEQFRLWFAEALKACVLEPNAMTLATVESDGAPSARIVLLKGFDEQGFVFYTHYSSRKGRALANNPRAALVFFWPELERQVRIVGVAAKVTREESQTYFLSRPVGSQIGAWASNQSEVLSDRRELEVRVHEFEKRSEEGQLGLPPTWGGYRVCPTSFEFWQGRPSRLHDRLLYEKDMDGHFWITRLSP